MTLSQYKEKSGLSYGELSKLWNIDRSQLCRYASGVTTPSMETAWRIEKLTKGQVGLYSWEKTKKTSTKS